MSKCVVCSTELKFMNTPNFGSGKLSDGGAVCSNCFKKINIANSSVASKLKKHSLSDIQNLLHDKVDTENNKSSKLDAIRAEIKSLGLDNVVTFLGRKEINELPSILDQNEKITNLIQGTYNGGQGILVATNRRLVFVDKGILYGLKVEDFPLDKITTIQYETGLLLAEVKIHTSGNIATIDNVEKAGARKFAESVRNQISQPIGEVLNYEPDPLAQLEKLGKLKAAGVLTEEEFSQQKKKLLEKI